MTERKFKVGDRVVLTDEGHKKWGEHKNNPRGVVGTVHDVGKVWIGVNWDNGRKNAYYDPDIEHYGQTLAELNVKAGDVVEFVQGAEGFETYTPKYQGTNSTVDTHGGTHPHIDGSQGWLRECTHLFRIISHTSDTPEWTICPPDYTPRDDHDVTYHMGVPTHYRVVEVVKDVIEPVFFDGDQLQYLTHKRNATLRGQTRNGKPVGQWVIDMDGVDG